MRPQRSRRRTILIALLVGLIADGARAWVTTELVSRRPDGLPGSDSSFSAGISGDGRWIAFATYADDLLAGDTNQRSDVYVLDRQTGVLTRESLAVDGAEANNHVGGVALSSNGRYVAFRSRAANLVPDDTNGRADVFVRDREAGTLERVSVGAPTPGGDAYGASISRDGQVVAFARYLGEIPFDEDGAERQVLVRDRSAGNTTVVGPGFEVDLSDDGRWVAFTTEVPGLVGFDLNHATDVLVYDRQTAAYEVVSVASDGTPGDQESSSPAISGDGRFVAFDSDATTLVPDDTNGASDVFVHDRVTGVTERMSLDEDGNETLADNYQPSISLDGRYVVFLRGGAHGFDVWLHDRAEGTTRPVSRAVDGTGANGCAFEPRVSTAPAIVAFWSSAGNLLVGDAEPDADSSTFDVYVAEDTPPVTSTTTTTTKTTTTVTTPRQTTSTAPPTTFAETTTTTSTTTTTLGPEQGCAGDSLTLLRCMLAHNVPPPACEDRPLPRGFVAALRRAALAAGRAADHGGRSRWLRRTVRALRRAESKIARESGIGSYACYGATHELLTRVQGLVRDLRPRAAVLLEPNAKISPRLAAAMAAAAQTDRIEISALFREPQRPGGAMITLQSVVQYASEAVGPGVTYLEIMSAEMTFPLAHALRVAGCGDIAAYFIGPGISAACTPAAIQDLARRSAVTEVDLNAF